MAPGGLIYNPRALHGSRFEPRRRRMIRARCLSALLVLFLVSPLPGPWGAWPRPPGGPVGRWEAPAGQMTWAVPFSLAPPFFDPGETPGLITPFLVLYAVHDALVKPMPGKP